MKFHRTSIPGVVTIELTPHQDSRGFFARMFCKKLFKEHDLPTEFVQMNTSYSQEAFTLRGLHLQRPPHSENKLIRCIQGALWDVILDLRADSPCFGKSIGIELSAIKRNMVLIPEGCAHGFLTLTRDTEVIYWVSAPYTPSAEMGIRWDDPAFAIAWPHHPKVVSEKDLSHPLVDSDFREKLAQESQSEFKSHTCKPLLTDL